MQRFLLASVLVLLSITTASAQNIKQLFDEGKSLFDSKQYALAFGKFEPLTALNQENDMVRYAHYYYAVSAYETGDIITAKNAFKQIQSKYSDWVNDDVNYWLGLIAVKQGNPTEAFDYLNKVSTDELSESVNVLKAQAIDSIDNINQLKSLLIEYPENVVASRLASEILRLDVEEQDLDLLDSLESIYDLQISLTLDDIKSSPKKEVYNVAMFLPFTYRNDSARIAQLESNWTTRMYHGALLGVEKLQEEGVKINLITIDTRDGQQRLDQMIASGQLDSLDFIIGPVTQQAVETITKFSKERKINMINPLSSNSEILVENPYAFLYYPSNESLALRSADYAIKHFAKNKNTAIFYSGAADYERAQLYRELIEKDSFNVNIFMRVPPDESVKIQQLFVEEEEVDRDSLVVAEMIAEMDSLRDAEVEEWEIYSERDFVYDTLKILPDSIGHIFIASDFSQLSTSALSGIAARPDTVEFISSSRFLAAEQSFSFTQLERLNAIFVGSNYMDYSTENIKEFREKYVNTFLSSPVKEERLGDAYMGYDIVVTFGRLLNQYGKYFQVGLRRRGTVEGELTEKLIYKLSNDNRFMPYLRVRAAEVVKVEDQEYASDYKK
ncbi:MAG: hypothetical protein HWE21_10225 [Cytophagia bacterium]|nr:hypothetical protein [Cytophagia bacterium]